MSTPYEWAPSPSALVNLSKKYGIHKLIDDVDNDNYAIMLFQC